MAAQFVTGRSPLHQQPEATSGRAGQPPCSVPPPGAPAGGPAAANAPEAAAGLPAPSAAANHHDGDSGGGGEGSYNSDDDDEVDEENPFNFPLPTECLRNMGLSDDTVRSQRAEPFRVWV